MPSGQLSHKKGASTPELSYIRSGTRRSSKSPNNSSVSSREDSPISSSILDKNQRDTSRRSSDCLSGYRQYSQCDSKRRLSLPVTSHKFYYSGPTLQPPPIQYKKIQYSSSSSGKDSPSPRILRNQRQELSGSEKSKRTFCPQTHVSSTSSQPPSDTQNTSKSSQASSFLKRQSSGSIVSLSSQTESYVPSNGSICNSSTITSSSSSSSNEVPEHRSSCASIHSFSTQASSKCYSVSDSRRSSGADTWNRSICSGITSTRSR